MIIYDCCASRARRARNYVLARRCIGSRLALLFIIVFIGTAVAASAAICIEVNGGMMNPGAMIDPGGVIPPGSLGTQLRRRRRRRQLFPHRMQRPQLRRRQLLPQRRHKIRNLRRHKTATEAAICSNPKGGMFNPGGMINPGGIIQTGSPGTQLRRRQLFPHRRRRQLFPQRRHRMQRPQLRRRQLLPQRRHKIRNLRRHETAT